MKRKPVRKPRNLKIGTYEYEINILDNHLYPSIRIWNSSPTFCMDLKEAKEVYRFLEQAIKYLEQTKDKKLV